MARAALTLAIALSVGIGARPAEAAIDLSRPWFVEVQIDFGGPPGPEFTTPCHWNLAQSGADLSGDGFCRVAGGPFTFTLAGTIDSVTGAFTLTDSSTTCSGSCFTYRGTATSDGLSFAGVVEEAATTFTRTFTGALCQNGVLDGAEGCDVGFKQLGDCCDSSCQLRAAGSICGSDDGGDNHACTGFACDGAGTCTGPGAFPAGTPCGHVHDGCAFPTCDGAGSCTSVATLADGQVCGGQCLRGQGLCQAGVCSATPRPAGTECEVDDNYCTLEACDAAGECQADTPRPAGERCYLDSDPCTVETCDGVGTCQAGGCSPCCDDSSGTCTSAYDPSCEHPVEPRASLAIRGRYRLAWKWQGGDETEFGDAATQGATICAYYRNSPTLLLAADARTGSCGGRPCWTASGTRTRYRDAAALEPRSITLRTGQGSSASIAVRGIFFSFTDQPYFPIHMQLKIADRCWESTFATGKLGLRRLVAVGGSPSGAFIDRDAGVVP